MSISAKFKQLILAIDAVGGYSAATTAPRLYIIDMCRVETATLPSGSATTVGQRDVMLRYRYYLRDTVFLAANIATYPIRN